MVFAPPPASYRPCSLVELYPGFQTMLRKALIKIVGESVEKAVRIEVAKDGSGVGGRWNSTRFFARRSTDWPYSCAMRTRGNEARRYCVLFDRSNCPVLNRFSPSEVYGTSRKAKAYSVTSSRVRLPRWAVGLMGYMPYIILAGTYLVRRLRKKT